MKLSCWTALFPYLPWLDACRIIRVLGFGCVDLIARPAAARASTPWDGLDLESIVAQPKVEGAALRALLQGLELEPAAMLVMPPGEWGERPEHARTSFGRVAQFCEAAGVPVVAFAASDVVGPSQAPPADYEAAAAQLRSFEKTTGVDGEPPIEFWGGFLYLFQHFTILRKFCRCLCFLLHGTLAGPLMS